MARRNYTYLFFFLFFLSYSCQPETSSSSVSTDQVPEIFSKLSKEKSGIDFSNDLKEDSIINYFTYPYIYMGGGVAVGDINNDGFQDLYFTGNMVENKLYLNNGEKGLLSFTDITEQTQVGADNRWVTGVTMADVNADGWMDIYVSVSGKFTTKKNLLYINNGILENGIPSFTESAEERGVADEGSSTQGTFFDYDNDGDLDLYVANYPYTSFKTPNYSYRIFINDKDPKKSDKLYANDGNGFFKDVSESAGILNFGLSLSATTGDFNNDGWQDLYVSNDFATPDILYMNNGDGTFTDELKSSMRHTSYFGMGTDVSDFNNDGLLDILQMDMTPKDNRRNKANMASMDVNSFWEIVNMDMHYQYMQNSLQLNMGITKNGIPKFSDVARISGMASTDWSWAGLFTDLDNDGWKDVFITNGTRRDINNKDYFNAIDKAPYAKKKSFNNLDLTLEMPSEKIDNFVFKNLGNLQFQPVVKDWGLSFEGFSNGAAYSDLDNDGDLEIIINNIDAPAMIYQNKSSDLKLANYLKVKLAGSEKNPNGLGAKLTLQYENGLQYQEVTQTRGFQSSIDPIINFGLGKAEIVKSISITWPDGKISEVSNIPANQMITIDYKNSQVANKKIKASKKKLFANYNQESQVNYKHQENIFDDYEHEVLLPHTYSANGPGIAKGDVNNDGREDFFVGAALGNSGLLYLQNADGSFKISASQPWEADKISEDMGALLFDADGDKDLDLYVISGGNEYKEGDRRLLDRLYLNNGAGVFEKSDSSLPKLGNSGSRIKAADYDGDGDLDLFVGGRIVPRSYPTPAKSFILQNDGVKNGVPIFSNVTSKIAPELLEMGLVTDMAWSDIDQDDDLDLILVGEWMPITILLNSNNQFTNKTKAFGLSETTGWWYSIAVEDFDKDGDLDFAAGNLGLNYKYQADEKETFDIYINDYDKNGKMDIVLGYYNEGVQYPVRGRQCSAEQIPTIKYKYKDYNTFAAASLSDIYTDTDLKNSTHYQAKTFAHTYFENSGEGSFKAKALPNAAQISSINDFIVEDFNNDGHLDLLAAGNLYGAEVETTRNDAGYGFFLTGDGKGNFKSVDYANSGLLLEGDIKDLEMLSTINGKLILAAANNDSLQVIRCN